VTGVSDIVTADSDKGVKIGHDQSELAVTFVWNGWSRSIVMSGHNGAEYADPSKLPPASLLHWFWD
jgi:hypothetical protein